MSFIFFFCTLYNFNTLNKMVHREREWNVEKQNREKLRETKSHCHPESSLTCFTWTDSCSLLLYDRCSHLDYWGWTLVTRVEWRQRPGLKKHSNAQSTEEGSHHSQFSRRFSLHVILVICHCSNRFQAPHAGWDCCCKIYKLNWAFLIPIEL